MIYNTKVQGTIVGIHLLNLLKYYLFIYLILLLRLHIFIQVK